MVARSVFTARLLDGFDDGFLDRAERPGANVFQSRVFMRALFATIGGAVGASPVLVGVSDTDGNAVALFAFSSRRRFGLQIIEGLDLQVSDYFAPTVLRDEPLTAAESDQVWEAVLRALPQAHAVTFKKLPHRLHGANHALTRSRFLKPMGASATTLQLRDAKGEPIPNAALQSTGRDVRRKLKKLEAHGGVSFAEAVDADEIAEAMDALVAFRSARFAALGRHDPLGEPAVEAFYRHMLTGADGPAIGRIFTLRVGGEIVAAVYGFCADGVFTLLVPAISPKPVWQAGSPGFVLLSRILDWRVAQGLRAFDLSVGSLHYKSRFDAGTVELFEAQIALTPSRRTGSPTASSTPTTPSSTPSAKPGTNSSTSPKSSPP